MSKILFIDACLRDGSRTRELAQELLSRLDGCVEQVRLYETAIAPLDQASMEIRGQAEHTGDYSHPYFDLAKQFAIADTVVIAAPYWDLMFPAVLKVYLENVTVSGLTFRYSEKGAPESLCRAKELYYVTTSGGYIGANDFGFSYINALAQGFFGIRRVRRYAAQGLDIFGADVDAILRETKAQIAAEL